MIDFDTLLRDYLDPNPFDDDDIVAYKEAMRHLPQSLLQIWLVYCEEGTYTGVARRLKSSPPTAKKVVDRIRKLILDYDI